MPIGIPFCRWVLSKGASFQTCGRCLGCAGPGLLPLQGHHAPRREAAQHHDRPLAAQAAFDRLGPGGGEALFKQSRGNKVATLACLSALQSHTGATSCSSDARRSRHGAWRAATTRPVLPCPAAAAPPPPSPLRLAARSARSFTIPAASTTCESRRGTSKVRSCWWTCRCAFARCSDSTTVQYMYTECGCAAVRQRAMLVPGPPLLAVADLVCTVLAAQRCNWHAPRRGARSF